MKLLVIISVLVLYACQRESCDQISIKGFTDAQMKRLTLYKNVNGDVLKEIMPDEETGWMSQIIKSDGDYLQIKIQDLNLKGWVKKGSLYLNTRNYDGQDIVLYKRANKSSEINGLLKGEQMVKVIDGCGKWALVEGAGKNGKIKGWIEPNMQCGNPYTTCP